MGGGGWSDEAHGPGRVPIVLCVVYLLWRGESVTVMKFVSGALPGAAIQRQSTNNTPSLAAGTVGFIRERFRVSITWGGLLRRFTHAYERKLPRLHSALPPRVLRTTKRAHREENERSGKRPLSMVPSKMLNVNLKSTPEEPPPGMGRAAASPPTQHSLALPPTHPNTSDTGRGTGR